MVGLVHQLKQVLSLRGTLSLSPAMCVEYVQLGVICVPARLTSYSPS